jgi:hypothetical protein
MPEGSGFLKKEEENNEAREERESRPIPVKSRLLHSVYRSFRRRDRKRLQHHGLKAAPPNSAAGMNLTEELAQHSIEL